MMRTLKPEYRTVMIRSRLQQYVGHLSVTQQFMAEAVSDGRRAVNQLANELQVSILRLVGRVCSSTASQI